MLCIYHPSLHTPCRLRSGSSDVGRRSGLFQKMSGGGGEEVLLNHPSLPPLRDFQVASIPALYIPHKAQYGQFQADIIASAADEEDDFHILSCLPTGYGKSLPMLLLSLFLPPGMNRIYGGTCRQFSFKKSNLHQFVQLTRFCCRFNYCNSGAFDIHRRPAKTGVHPTWIVCCCWKPGGRPLELCLLNITQFNSAGA